jgi:lysozyme
VTVSSAGLLFIARFEGYRARAYRDVGGIPTIGYGHVLGRVWRTAYALLWWSNRKALRVLRADAARADVAVSAYCRKDLSQHEHDALVSFTFNCGAGALAHSTLLLDVNRKASSEIITADFTRWSHVGGIPVPGLVTRRHAEARLYLTGKYV